MEKINLLDPKTIKKLLNELDQDCAQRMILAALGGRKAFLEQMNIECGIQNRRNQEKA